MLREAAVLSAPAVVVVCRREPEVFARVFGADGLLVAAVSVTAPTERLGRGRRATVPAVLRVAGELTP